MPIIFVVSLLISVSMGALSFYFQKRFYQSSAYQNLNLNLSQLELFWSDSKSDILPLNDNAVEKDQKTALNSLAAIVLIACLTSFLGCLLLLLYILSYRKLAKPRLEKKILTSKLAGASNISKDEAREIVLALKAEFSLKNLQLE